MNRTAVTFALALVLGAWSCKSQDSSAPTENAYANADSSTCICGDPAADIYGCNYIGCLDGAGNPDNDLCVCAPLVAAGTQTTSVSYGGAAVSRELGRRQSLSLADSSIVRGVLRSDDGLSVTLELSNGGSQVIPYAELAPRSIYRLMKGRTSKDDGPALIALGNYTRDHGLYAYSKRHYSEALSADPALEPQLEREVAKLRQVASDDLLARAQAALAKGDADEAEKQLSRILTELPDEPAAETARTIMGELASQAESQRMATEAKPMADASAIAKELKPAQVRYDRAVEENRKGMLSYAGSSAADRHFEKAVKEGGLGRKLVANSTKRNPELTGLAEAAGGLDGQLVDVMVTANLNSASVAMSRSSYNKALDYTNQALALDPENAEAISMRSRIQHASSRSGIGSGNSWGSGLGGWYLGSGAGVRGTGGLGPSVRPR